MKNTEIEEEMKCLAGIEKRLKTISSMPGDPKKLSELRQAYIDSTKEIIAPILTSPFTKKYFEKLISKYES